MKINGNLVRFNLSHHMTGYTYNRPEDVPYFKLYIKERLKEKVNGRTIRDVEEIKWLYKYDEIVEWFSEIQLPKNYYVDAYPRKSTKRNHKYELRDLGMALELINEEGLIVAFYDATVNKLYNVDEDFKKYKNYLLKKFKDYLQRR